MEITDLIWKNKYEDLTLKSWYDRKIENSNFSNGEELEVIVSKICKRICFSDLIFFSPKYIDNKGIQKEICDLLILHDETVLVFQIKHRKLSEDKEFNILTQRATKTYNHTISQFETIYKIIKTREQLSIKNLLGYEVIIDFDKIKRVEFIGLICFPGRDTFDKTKKFEFFNSFEFYKDFPTHVFDIDDFDKITKEFDTTEDLLDYLIMRTKFYGNINIGLVKELDLLAMIKIHNYTWKQFLNIDYKIIIEEGLWGVYVEKVKQITSESIKYRNYYLDLILEIAYNSIDYTDNSLTPFNRCINDKIQSHISLLLKFSLFRRSERKIISQAIVKCIFKADENNKKNSPYAFNLIRNENKIGFIVLSVVSNKRSRQECLNFLTNLCLTALHKFSLDLVLGLSTESFKSKERSEVYIGFEKDNLEKENSPEFLEAVKEYWN